MEILCGILHYPRHHQLDRLLLLPETNGHTLEEMARIFDGDDAAVPKEGRVRESIAERGGSISVDIKKNDIMHVESL
jgi:hypothetical protein